MRMITLVLPEDRSYVRLNNLGDYNEIPTECDWEISEGNYAFGYRNKGGLKFNRLSKERRDRILDEFNKSGLLPRVDIYEDTLRVYFGINRSAD